MSLLNFGSSDGKSTRNRNSLKLVLGIGALAGTIALGSTLAANINLNSDGNVEFGQGVATTTACDDDGITVTPFSTFINAAGAGSHKLSSIQLSEIDSSEDNCEGKTFRIRAYGDGSDPLDLFSWETGVMDGVTQEYVWTEENRFDFVDITRTDETFLWTSDGTDDDDVIDIDDSNIEQTSFTLSLVSLEETIRRTPLALAEDVKKITVETFDADGEQLNNQTTSFNWLVLAAGERSVVEAETVRNEPVGHNGSYWYNTPETSRGFSLDQTVNQNGCDTEDSNANYRLCWHIGSGYWISNGYRAGDEDIDGNITGNIVRAIYTSDAPTYYPSGPQINVLKSDLTAGGWTRCYYGDYGDSVTNAEVASCTGAYVLYAGGYPDPSR
jgi:hypothetical protein